MIERQDDPLCEVCGLNDASYGYCVSKDKYECSNCHFTGKEAHK